VFVQQPELDDGTFDPPRDTWISFVVVASVVFHVALLWFLLTVPIGQRLVERILPVDLVERKKPPPQRPKVKRPQPRPPARPRVRSAAPHRPQAAPQDSEGTDGFGMAPDDGGAGTFEVPIGQTLEAPATTSAPGAPAKPRPLVLEVGDDGSVPPVSREPAPVGQLRAVYPEIPRLAGATGSAVIEAFVDAAGLVGHATLLSATGPAFGKSALEAIKQTRFQPAVRMGVPVARSIRIPVLFELSGSLGPIVTATVSEPVEEPVRDLVSAEASANSSISIPVTGGSGQ
jgi:protein TonB